MPPDGPVALLLPGMTLNATIFPALPFPTITADFTELVLGPDGASPTLAARRMGLYADLLDERLTAEPAWSAGRRIVIAHSFGGMLALTWWLARGGAGTARVDGMVLIATSAGPMFDAAKVLLARVVGRDIRMPLTPLITVWNWPMVTRSMKRLLSGGSLQARRVDFQALEHTSDWAVDSAGWRNTDWRAMRSFRLAMKDFDVRAKLREINIPVIVLHGTRDTLLPDDNARTLASGLPRAELRWVPGAGHVLPLTHGNTVVKAAEDLLKQ